MRLQPCLDKNTVLTKDQKAQVRADTKVLIDKGLKPFDAANNAAYAYLNPLKLERQRVEKSIRAYYDDLVKRAKAAGKPIYEPPAEKGPEPSLDMPMQPGLPGIFNPVLRDILTMKIEPTRDDLLVKLSNKEFNALNEAFGFPVSGNRVVKVDRFLALIGIRKKLQDYATTFGGAKAYSDQYSKPDLKAQAATAKIWKSGSKQQLAGALLSWRDRSRRKGLTALIDSFDQAGMSERAQKFRDALATPLGTIGAEAGEQPGYQEGLLTERAKQSRDLADWVQGKIENQDVISWRDLFKAANKAFGGTQSEGVYTPKDAYDAMELGVNRYILGNISFILPNGERKSPELVIRQLKEIGDLLPTQSKRTQEQEDFQQFSTPPFLAYAANHVANIQTGDVYLEPSAGIGGLAIFGKMSNAKRIFVNELSERRLDLLRVLDFSGYFNEDAAQLDNVIRDDFEPTVIVMNPPFSSTAGRLKRNMTTYGAKHVEQALKRLAPGGRLVAIVGKGMSPTAPTFKKWWRDIDKKYTVRANVGISGQEYRKYGTTFDNRLLVIDKIKPKQYAPKEHIPVWAEVDKVDTLPKLLEDVRNDRPKIHEPGEQGEQPPIQPPLPEPPEEGEGKPPRRDAPLPEPTDLGDQETEGGPPGGTDRPPGDIGGGQPEADDGILGDQRPPRGTKPRVPSARPPGTTELGPGRDPGVIPTAEAGDLSLDDLEGLIDEVAAEEGIGQPPKAAKPPSAPTTTTKAPKQGPPAETGDIEESDFDDLAGIIDGIEIKEAQAPYGNLVHPEAYVKAKPIFEKTYQAFLSRLQAQGHIPDATNTKEWVRAVLTGLNKRGVNPDISKNWILYFYQNDRPAPAAPSEKERKKLAIKKAKKKYAEIEDKLYERYTATAKIKGAKKHPTLLDESAALADTTPPPPTYRPTLPQAMIDSGKTSDAQLENVVYAGQAHEQVLPSGERKGFFVGAGTGVGKGRIIASILLDNWNKGRKKAVWISETSKLADDARRDLGYDKDRQKDSGIGWKEGVDALFTLGSKHKLGVSGKKFPQKQGILFTTYSTLRSNFTKINTTEAETLQNMRVRINQIVDWLGKDFDGVIAFDESHNMANATAQRGERGTKAAANQALAGIMLQNRLPNARVVYVSATGATEVSNFAYAERLGLWGEGTAFPRKQNFIDEISGSGLAAMEMIARDMKSQGLYLAPALSYDGVTYDRITHPLDERQRKKYDELAGAWQIVLQNIHAALATTNQDASGRAKMGIWSQFWGGHQRFFNQVITTMQMGTAITHIEEQLKKGHSIVLQLVNHGGAQIDRVTAARTDDQELEDLDFTPREALMSYIRNSFPVHQYEHYTDADGNDQVRPVHDSDGKPVLNREAVAMREELLNRIGAINIASSPLDLILDHFGTDQVAEVTGRKRRVVRDPETGKTIEEKWSDAKANNDAEAFMNDEKRILVFSQKGGTGRSYHADLDTDNHRKRIHYLVQPGWRADKAIQGLGRTHRSNQAQAPEYYLLTTDLNAQKRFISSIARRLDQLGALTKGQRQTGSQGIFQARDNMESDYARVGLYRLFEDIVAGEGPITAQEFYDQTALQLLNEDGGLTSLLPSPQKFMNRLLSMTIADQNTVFDAWSDRIDAVIDAAAAAGTLDVGIETITGLSIDKVEDKVVNTDANTGAETRYVRVELEVPSRRKPWEAVVADRFYVNKKSGRLWAASPIRTRTDASGNVYEYRTLTSPAGSNQVIRMADLFTEDPEAAKFEELKSEVEAQALWEDQYADSPPTVKRDVHLITGALLPIWDRLKGSATVNRLQTDGGERFLGRVIHANKIDEVLENLGVEADPIDLTGEEVAGQIMGQDAIVRLSNGWRMKRVMVSGEERIELLGPNFDHWDQMTKYGVIMEKINYKTRYFIPTGAKSGSTMDALTKFKPIVNIELPYAGPQLSDQILNEPQDLLEKFGKGKQVQLSLFGGNQGNLFTDTKAPSATQQMKAKQAAAAKKVAAAKIKKQRAPRQVVTLQKTGDISHFGTKVRNWQEAGALMSFLANKAAEEAYTVAVDKDGTVLQIHKISKGSSSSASVPIIEAGGTFLREDDAQKVYFVHQHPSGKASPSPEDTNVVRSLRAIGSLKGQEVIGVIVTADKVAKFDPDGIEVTQAVDLDDMLKLRVASNLNTSAAEPKTKLPIKERFVKPVRGWNLKGLPEIRDSKTAMQHIEKTYGGLEGFLVLDSQNRDLAFLPWKGGRPTKETTRELIEAIEGVNGAALVINWKDPGTGQVGKLNESRIKFLQDLMESIRLDLGGLTLHDVVVDGKSWRDSGLLLALEKKVALLNQPTNLKGLVAEDILFSRKVAPPADPLPVQKVQQAINPFVTEMKTKPGVTVLAKQSSLPAEVRSYLRSVGGENDVVVGAFHNGRVYLVAENISSEREALRALFHETFGHFGIRGVLGADLDKMLNNVYIAKRADVEAIATEYGYNLRTKEGRAAAAEEWLAREAEVNPNSSWIDRLVALIRKWMRKVNQRLVLSDAEIRALIGQARKYVASNQKATVFPPIRFDRLPETADRWYSQMEQYLGEKLDNRGTAATYKAMLENMVKGGKIKAEELQWSGLLDYLDTRTGKVSKADIMEYLAENNVKLEETVKSESGLSDIEIDTVISWQQAGNGMSGEFYNPYADEQVDIGIYERDGQFVLDIMGDDYGTFQSVGNAQEYAQQEVETLMSTWEGIEGTQFQPTRPYGSEAVKHPTLVQPGGKNYKELLIRLPVIQDVESRDRIKELNELTNAYKATPEQQTELNLLIEKSNAGIYKSPVDHFEESNILVSVRFNERIDRDGKRVLFLEEIQSDWHAKGRDEGYRKKLGLEFEVIEMANADSATRERYDFVTSDFVVVNPQTGVVYGVSDLSADDALAAARTQFGVPDAPFKKTHRLLAMKRMVRWAAENDFDSISWTPGQMQADRYNLSRKIKSIEVFGRYDSKTGEKSRSLEILTQAKVPDIIELGVNNKGIVDNVSAGGQLPQAKGSPLADVVGKDLAKKIMGMESGLIEGIDLDVGGMFLKKIYDKILPNEINKFFNKAKWGKAKVVVGTIESNIGDAVSYAEFPDGINVYNADGEVIRSFPAGEEYLKEVKGLVKKERNLTEVWTLPITPQMKAKALYKGMPMFARKRHGDYDIMSRLPEEVRDRMARARGVPKEPWTKRAKEKIAYLKSLRQHFPGLTRLENVTEANQLADILRQHQEIPETAKDQAVRAITKFTKPLSQSEYEVFRTHIILSDMMRDVEEGLLSDEKLKDGETLPFGFENVGQLQTTFEVFDQMADETPAIRKSLDARKTMINKMVRQMVKFKILKKEVMKHKDYFHHQVLSFWAGNKMKTAGTSSADVRTHWRPWMAARKGSLLDYNTEYVEAEFAALAQQMAQIETAKTLDKIKKKSDIYRDLKTSAKYENLNRFYDDAAESLSKMFGQNITPAEVKADHKLDPLFSYKQNIAMASSNLRRMAFKGKIDGVDSQWDDVLDALAEEYQLSKMGIDEDALGLTERPTISDGRYFAFLSYLINTKKPGAMWAATTFKAIKGRERAIKGALGDRFVTYKQLIPENYSEWKPDPKKGWFWANSIADNIVQKIIEGEKALEDRDVRKVLAKGQELIWVIPEGLAETLDNFRKYPDPHSLGRVADWGLRAWKQWVLLNPRRAIKYNVNNMSGDLDITMAYAPGIATPAAMVKSLRDLRKWHKRQELPEGIQAEIDNARRKGVIGSGFAVQEVEDVLGIMSMDRWVREVLLGEKPNIAMRYWEKTKGITVIRENMLRLAAYRWFRKQLDEGKAVYGASKRVEIDAIRDKDDRAAKLARELIGDYGNISAAGQYIRQRLIPFYSWMEINLPRYVYLMKNLRSEDRHSDAAATRRRMAGILSKRTLTGATKLAIKANLIMGAVLLWNMLMHRDEWEEMGEAKRRQQHLILGRNEAGEIQTIRFQGALSDALAWFGLEDWPADLVDIKERKASLQEKMLEVPKAAATKAIHGIRPEPKLMFEALTAESTYPDPFSPRPIRDTTEHILRTFSLDSIYKMAAGKPGRGKTKAEHFLSDIKGLLLYTSDPGEQAYYDSRKMVFDWLDSQGVERPSGKPTNRSNALYYYRQALKYGDMKAAKRYLDKYYDMGGSSRSTRQSIKRAHPLGSLPMKHRFKFRQSLTPAEQERLKIALEWYEKIYKQKDLDIRLKAAKERYSKIKN